jgi:hypothetical protein
LANGGILELFWPIKASINAFLTVMIGGGVLLCATGWFFGRITQIGLILGNY